MMLSDLSRLVLPCWGEEWTRSEAASGACEGLEDTIHDVSSSLG